MKLASHAVLLMRYLKWRERILQECSRTGARAWETPIDPLVRDRSRLLRTHTNVRQPNFRCNYLFSWLLRYAWAHNIDAL
jgi:hypothetical protein